MSPLENGFKPLSNGGVLKVLLADDSPTMRQALIGLLARDPGFELVGAARDGEEAVALSLSTRPDFVLMDALMPGLDGLKATRLILSHLSTRILLISSALEHHELDLAFRGLQAGALEVLAKPAAGQSLREWGENLRGIMRRLSQTPAQGQPRSGGDNGAEQDGGAGMKAFALVASTGGPPVLARILSLLPPGLPIPLFLAQHLAPGFSSGLARWLSQSSGWQVVLAQEGEMPRPGRAYLAPDSRHLLLGRGGTILTPLGEGLCPSGDRLLESMAECFGSSCGAAVLTGMGEDGAQGLLKIKQSGGLCLAQDQDTCVVFGMPKAAISLGAAPGGHSPEQIAHRVLRTAGKNMAAET